jgi:hypothetical protein
MDQPKAKPWTIYKKFTFVLAWGSFGASIFYLCFHRVLWDHGEPSIARMWDLFWCALAGFTAGLHPGIWLIIIRRFVPNWERYCGYPTLLGLCLAITAVAMCRGTPVGSAEMLGTLCRVALGAYLGIWAATITIVGPAAD